jgi:phage baseplate assembly protein W
MTRYKGFTTHNYGKNVYTHTSTPTSALAATVTNFSIIDVDLVNRDLLNHIYTRPGERVMMPTFGTIIPDLVFEPLDDNTISLVEEEVLKVVTYDPRVNLINMTTVPDYDTQSISVVVTLLYIELNITQNLNIHIEFQ